MRFYHMDAVAIGAHRRLPVAPGERLSMNAAAEFGRDVTMASSAGPRNIEPRDLGLRIGWRSDVVTAVAVGARGRLRIAGSDRPAVNAFLIREERPRREAASFHYKLLTVA